jgi:hypothetical protein
VSLHVGTGKAAEVDSLLGAFARGRDDHQYFAKTFLGRTLHDGQLEFVNGAEAKVNALGTANRWGKTTVLGEMHFHAGLYKTGAEWRYLDEQLDFNLDVFTGLKYETVHTAGEWEQAQFVWEDMLKLIGENQKMLAPFIANAPRSKPPHIKYINGAKTLFRTLGTNASGIDGKSIYLLSIDEAGWIADLEEMMRNVLRIRTADVRGRIVIVGTMKPGISRDFYKVCVRASAYTGSGITMDHRTEAEQEDGVDVSLSESIRRYLAEFGINLDEYRDALSRGL